MSKKFSKIVGPLMAKFDNAVEEILHVPGLFVH
jgi:hypothetical protein